MWLLRWSKSVKWWKLQCRLCNYFEGKVFLGEGTNNLGELTALLLRAAYNKGLNSLQVFGDSEISIRWMQGRNQIQWAGLFNLATHLRVLSNTFDKISFEHIYRQHNVQADTLSKVGLTGPFQQIIEDEFRSETVVSTSTFHLQKPIIYRSFLCFLAYWKIRQLMHFMLKKSSIFGYI